MQDLLQLPLQVQATLVAGYLGYIILKRDYRKTEKLSDMWFFILLFGLPTASIIQFCDSKWAYLSVLTGPIFAFLWVKFADARWSDFLYRSRVSSRLNDGDVWKTIASHKGVAATQIKLFTKSGTCYFCINTSEFNDEPFAPFTMDDDGIAFYVTHIIAPEDEDWDEVDDVKLDSEYGYAVTYFPREDIKRLDMRFVKIP